MSIQIKNIEFFTTPTLEVMIHSEEYPLRQYEPEHYHFTALMIEYIREFYTAAYEALCSIYASSKLNQKYFEYLIVHRFIRCNFPNYDEKMDIDHLGNFHFETIYCPIRGRECHYNNIICNPVFNSKLTIRETEVMKLFYENCSVTEIADRLFISEDTIKNHKRNSLKKLGLHSVAEFNTFAAKHNLFNEL